MKTQIIQLEPHDDVISIRDKMVWSQTSRILLVWPNKGKILHQRLDMVLLQRHSFNLGAQLALVTQDEEIRSYAGQLKIPIFNSSREAQSKRWRTVRWRRSRSFRRIQRPDLSHVHEQIPERLNWLANLPAVRYIAFVLSLAAILAVIGTVLPGAQVTITPVKQIQEVVVPLQAGVQFSTVNLAGDLPAQYKTIQVEGRSTITSTGVTYLPVKPAEGIVKFTNLTDQEVLVPAGSVVSTLGQDIIRYKTTQVSKVWAGPGQIRLVPVEAIDWGKAGNQPAGSVQAIEGVLGFKLSVTNPSAMKKGADSPSPAPALEDQRQVHAQMQAELQQSAITEFLSAYTAQPEISDYPLAPTLRLHKVIEETYDPEIGQPGDQLQLTLRLEFTIMVVAGKDIQNMLNQVLDTRLPESFSPNPSTLVVNPLSKPSLDGQGIVHWKVNATREIIAQINPQEVINRLRGRRVDGLPSYLVDLPIFEASQAHLTPKWWPYFPILPFRINIQTITNPGSGNAD